MNAASNDSACGRIIGKMETSADVKNRGNASKVRAKRKWKKRHESLKDIELPSPPPNPRAIVYDNSVSKATVLGVHDAFDHLDKLHSMMEDIVEIRERNSKLFRRVRELERVKVTRKAHLHAEKLVRAGQDVILPDEDVGFAESLLGAMLASSFEVTRNRGNVGARGSVTSGGRVTRSRSINVEHRRVSCPVNSEMRLRNASRCVTRNPEMPKIKRPSLGIGTPKVSKWTRVKAAFKWERAACTNSDVSNVDNDVVVRYLKIPDNVAASGDASGPPTPAGTISSSSSIDDVFHRPQRPSSNQSTRITRRDESSDPSRRSRSLDGDASVPMNFVYSPRPRSKENSCPHGKSIDSRIHKTPWGKVKDMMQLRRDSVGRTPLRSISKNDDAHSNSSLEFSDLHRSEHQIDGRPPRVRVTGESSVSMTTSMGKSVSSVPNDFVDLATRRLTPTLTITVPSSEELRCISSPESITPPLPSARQSFESGRAERYCQPGYETPKEIRTAQVSPASSTSGILRYGLGRSKTCQGVPYAGDYKRQQSLKGESLGSSPKMQRRDSKWNKVKRAFLTSATSVPTSPSRISSYFFDDGDATGCSYSASASAEDLENDSATSPGVQAEIQRNYRLLHDKLGTEFYRKLAEWERLKSSTSGSIREAARAANARDRDNENLRLLGEERLTPEFKKKLEEWNRMNKGETRMANASENRSVNRRRITDWQLWRSSTKNDQNKNEVPRLSEDFMKKMEEWKRIKSAGPRRETDANRRTSETIVADEGDNEEVEEDDDNEEERNKLLGNRFFEERRRAWRSLEEEEFKSLERVLEAMEMDRQRRLSKLQRIVGSQLQRTQEVLIHTSTGLYRFEGISRKFTRKLYEWEKSQGISPELSTFRLLDPLRHGVGSLRTRTIVADANKDGAPRKILHRSKSVGCVDIESWRTTREHEKITIRRPCSLSLNDIDHIDSRNCILASSVPTIHDEEDTSEDIAMEDSEPEQEPEAVIVDIEDVIEETASPLAKYQPHQTPVYSVAGSETTSIAIPLGTVTARHEPSPVILIEPGEMFPLSGRVRSIEELEDSNFRANVCSAETLPSLPTLPTESRQDKRSIAAEGLRTNHENLDDDYDNLPTEDKKNDGDSSRIACIIDDQAAPSVSDSDSKWQMARNCHAEHEPINFQRSSIEEDETFEDSVITVRSNIKATKNLLKTRRLTDTQIGYDWQKIDRQSACNEVKQSEETIEDSLGEIGDDYEDNPNVERIIINEETINKIVVPTASSSSGISVSLKGENGELSTKNDDVNPSRKEKREATSVLVKTKRIVFSPFRRETKKTIGNSAETSLPIESELKIDNVFPLETAERSLLSEFEENDRETIDLDSRRPPLPKSPIFGRKEHGLLKKTCRETSPGVRTMIRRYNEKLEIDNDRDNNANILPISETTNSPNSSSNCRSFFSLSKSTTEHPDRYDSAKKPLSQRKIGCESNDLRSTIVKSSSFDIPPNLASCSVETRRERTMEPETTRFSFETPISGPEVPEDRLSSSTIRALKLRRAKEDFLSMEKSDERMEEEEERKISISQSEGSKDPSDSGIEDHFSRSDIVKSASVGMINVDPNTFERLQIYREIDDDRGCDSLPRSNEHLRRTIKESRFSQIASKFKRARFKRAKERESAGMSAISRLCRQSLLVDIANDEKEAKNNGDVSGCCSKSDAGRGKDNGEGKKRR